ncbi:MAG: response regulator transcription factor [Proteobacteria bacterium]|nr:response regulator transcription factor [Pseudomonadota bacterium]
MQASPPPGVRYRINGHLWNGTMNCVLLAGRHHGLGEGIRALLESMFDKVFMVANQNALLDGAQRLGPEVIVMDVALAEGDAASLLSEIKRRAPRAKVLMLSVHDEPAVTSAMVAAGADGVVFTRAIATDLLSAVDSVCAGGRFVSAAPLGSR